MLWVDFVSKKDLRHTVPQKFKAPITQNVPLLENRVIANIIKIVIANIIN